MRTLDRSKPFQQVCGGSEPYAFIQAGVKFMGDGTELPGQDGAPETSTQVTTTTSTAADVGIPLFSPEAQAAAEKLLDQSVDKIIPELPDVSDEVLAALKACETAGKTRVTLIRAIDEELASRGAKNPDQADKQLEG